MNKHLQYAIIQLPIILFLSQRLISTTELDR